MAKGLTTRQLDELRRKLQEERARILQVLAGPAPAPQADQNSEFEEAAQRTTELTQRLEIEARERALLVEVEQALARLGEGTYGVSEATGEPIPFERLRAVPWARGGVED